MLPEERRIKSKEQLKEWIKIEVERQDSNRLKMFLGISERAIIAKHQVLLRKTEYYINTKKRIRGIIYKIRLHKFQNKYSLHIPVNCADKGLYIVHLGSIIINKNAVLGKNVTLHMNTGIVAGGTNDDSPVLGNGVIVGIGSIVLGGVHIADNVAIGANAVVNKDVLEPNIAVAGIPAKKISSNGSMEWNKAKREKWLKEV